MADSTIGASVLAHGVGVVGHCVGAYTALALAGAVPQLSLVVSHCIANRADTFCDSGGPPQAGGPFATVMAIQPVPVLKDDRIGAIVTMTPIGAAFSAHALRAVSAPARVYGAQFDVPTPAPYHAAVVAAALPQPSEYVLVKNATHFSFISPLPESRRAMVGPAAIDRPGFDRAQVHLQLNAEIVDFFNRKLR